MKYRQNDVHGSMLLTEGTKVGCFCPHTRVDTEQAGKPPMLLRSAKACVVYAEWMPSLLFTSQKCFKTAQKSTKEDTNTESTYDMLAYFVPSFRTFVTRLPASPTSNQVY